jgi:hypothetical protein
MSKELDDTTSALTKYLMDEGKLIEAGWIAFAAFVLPKNCGPEQYKDMKCAFFAGAQHLFGALNVAMEPAEAEVTDAEVSRIQLVHEELERFVEQQLQPLMPKARHS